MAAQQKAIETFMASLDNTTLKGTAALNEAITTLSGGKVTTIQALINQMVADCKETGDVTKFLQDYCGIDLTNTDTGAITGKDAGGSAIKTDVDIVPETSPKTLSTCTSGTFTVAGGATIKSSIAYDSMTTDQKYIWNNLYTWWANSSLKLITDSYGSNYGVGTNPLGGKNTIEVTFSNNKKSSALASMYNSFYDKGENAGIGYPSRLEINMYYYNSISTSDSGHNGISTVSGATYLDRTLAHEFTHAVMSNNIMYFNNLPQFIKEGMAELTHGIDDLRTQTIKQLAGNSTKLNKSLDLKNTKTGTVDAYAGGYMFLRYLAKELQTPTYTTVAGGDYYSNYNNTSVVNAKQGNDTVRNRVDNATISGGAGNDYLINNKKVVVLFGDADNDTITNTGANVTIDGGAGNDSISNTGANVTINGGAADTNKNTNYIYNSSKNVSIISGASSDTIESKGTAVTIDSGAGNDSIIAATKTTVTAGAGNDTITGAGNNVYIFGSNDGSNLITKFVPKTDVIYLTGITSADEIIVNTLQSSDDTNLVFKAGSTFVTVTGAGVAGAKVKFNNGTKDVTQTLKSAVFGAGNDTYYNFKAGAKLNALGGDDYVYNAANKTVLIGGDGNDQLLSAYTANVTLNGGNDNDYIVNYGAKSMLIGGAGNETIYSVGSKNTINGGAGIDAITLEDGSAGNVIVYGNNDGIDAISGLNGTDMLYLSGVNTIDVIDTLQSGVMKLFFGTKTTDSLGNISYGTEVRIANPGTVKVKYKNNKVVTLQEQTTPTANSDYINNYASVGGTSYNLSTGNDTLNNYVANAVINGDAGDDYIYNYKNAKTSVDAAGAQLIGGAGNDSLYNQAENVTLDGGADDDYLNSTAANVTITGGTGIDTIALNAKTSKANFINYAAGDGNDVITGFNGDDTLNITSGGQFVTVKSGANLLVKIVGSDDYITLKNIGKASITGATQFSGYPTNANLGIGTIVGSANGKTFKISPAVLSTSTFSGSVDLRDYPTAKGFYGADTSGGVTVKGNWQNDYLVGGSGNDSLNGYAGNNTLVGGAGNDTLIGSTGNDSLQGDSGADTFIYNGGKDVIVDYKGSDGDVIDLGNNVLTDFSSKNYDVTLKIGKATITLKDAARYGSIQVNDALGSVVIGSTAVSNPLIAEDDIPNNDVLLDEIIETPIVGDFEIGSSTRDTVQSALAYSEDF